ncbi:hypothetical protein XENORESO_001814, partial [Xenotaenia resolanae]
YQCGSVRHVPSLDSISCAVDGVHLQPSSPYLLYACDESGRSLSEGNSPSRLSRRGSRGRYGSTADYGRHAAQSRRVSRRDMTTVRMNYSYYILHPTCLLTIRSPSHRILSLVPTRSTQFKPFALKHQSPPSIKPVVLVCFWWAECVLVSF